MAVIVDTSVLYALTDRAEARHEACRAALQAEREAVVIPQPVLSEVCYLIGSRLGAATEVRFLRGLAESDWRLEPLTSADLDRVVRLLEAYPTANLGYVDAAVVACAERLKVERIYTFDHRDFGLIRPEHVTAFSLLP